MKENFIGMIAVITASLTGLGLVISNIYLSQYHLIDFAIISTKSLYTGFTFIIFILLTSLFFLSFLDMTCMLNNNLLVIILNFIIKPIFLSSAFFFLTQVLQEPPPKNIYLISAYSSCFFAASAVVISLFGIFYAAIKSDKGLIKRFIKILVYITCAIVISGFIFLYAYQDEYTHIANFFLLFSLTFFMNYFVLYGLKYDESVGKPRMNFSLFNPSSTSSRVVFLDIILALLSIIYLLSTCLVNYSKVIYPHIPFEYGGGKPQAIEITLTSNDFLSGSLIYQDSSRYYLLISNNANQKVVRVVDISSIESIHK